MSQLPLYNNLSYKTIPVTESEVFSVKKYSQPVCTSRNFKSKTAHLVLTDKKHSIIRVHEVGSLYCIFIGKLFSYYYQFKQYLLKQIRPSLAIIELRRTVGNISKRSNITCASIPMNTF